MAEKKQGYPDATPSYPPSQGFSPTGFPETGFSGPAYNNQQQQGGYGAPPPAGFIYINGTPPAHSGYDIPQEDNDPKPHGGTGYGELNGIDFSEKSIRMAFIRKVYGILSLQLLATTGLIALFTLHQGVRDFTRDNFGFVLIIYIASIIVLCFLACCEGLRRKSPHNMILLALFTLTYGTVIGVISSQYQVDDVLKAAGVTVIVCVALTIFSFQTKYDFTMMGGALFVCMIVLMVFSFFAIFFGPTFQLVLAGAGAMLFSVYLVYDTQMMIGGTHKYSISPEEYVFASLNIYMDVIMIFIYILRIFGSSRN